jgi:hypothetical protein
VSPDDGGVLPGDGDDATVEAREAVTAPTVAREEAERDDAGRSLDVDGDHSGWSTQAVMFCSIGAFMALIGVVYWFMSYEWTGSVLLWLTSAMAIGSGVYLGWPRGRGAGAGAAPVGPPPEPGHDPHDGVWFPEASVWPFAIGAGMVLVANGLLLGRWLFIPAVVFLAWSLAGMVRQGRRRL